MLEPVPIKCDSINVVRAVDVMDTFVNHQQINEANDFLKCIFTSPARQQSQRQHDELRTIDSWTTDSNNRGSSNNNSSSNNNHGGNSAFNSDIDIAAAVAWPPPGRGGSQSFKTGATFHSIFPSDERRKGRRVMDPVARPAKMQRRMPPSFKNEATPIFPMDDSIWEFDGESAMGGDDEHENEFKTTGVGLDSTGSIHPTRSELNKKKAPSASARKRGSSLQSKAKPKRSKKRSRSSNISKSSSSDSIEDIKFRPYQSDQWKTRYHELVEFHSIHNHCIVEPKDDKTLSHWVKRQRYQMKQKQDGKHSTLTDERQDLLQKLGFVWDSHDAAWEYRFNDLILYRAKYGHTNVPTQCSENPSLGIWAKGQRRQYRLHCNGERSTMTESRIRRLDEVDFPWLARPHHSSPPQNEQKLPSTESDEQPEPSNYQTNNHSRQDTFEFPDHSITMNENAGNDYSRGTDYHDDHFENHTSSGTMLGGEEDPLMEGFAVEEI